MKKHILVVDDEKYIVQMLSDAFEQEGMEVGTALNGEEALAYVRQNSVDLVITDIMMPKLDGISLFYEMRKIDPFIQIIIITGYPSIQNIMEMLEAGASDFIIKPFDIAKLKQIVGENFSRIERWRSLRSEWLEHKKQQGRKPH